MTIFPLPLAATPSPTLAQFGSGGGGMFAGFFILGIILVVVFLVGGLGSLAGLLYIGIRALKQPSLSHGLANCGRCGYGVRGNASLACPECGADFREVGIRSPNMNKPFIGPVLFIALWSLCLWIPGCVVSSVVIAAGPQQQIYYEDVDLDPPDKKAAGYDNIMLNQTPHGMYSDWPSEFFPQQSKYIDVDIYGPNGNEWYEVNIANNTFQDYNGMVANPMPFDRKTLERWISTVGGDTKNADVQTQIDQIYNNIQQAQTKGLSNADWTAFSVNSQSNWSQGQPAGWFILVQPAFWIIIYAVGIALYFFLKNRYDKGMAELIAQQPVTPNPYAPPSQQHGFEQLDSFAPQPNTAPPAQPAPTPIDPTPTDPTQH